MDEATLRVACRFADESEQMAAAVDSQLADDPSGTPGNSAQSVPSYRAAIAWFDDNLPEVLGLLGALRAAEEWDLTFRLGHNLILYLLRRRSWHQAEEVALLAADAALHSERPDREVQVLQAVGIARQMKGDDRGADEVFQRLDVLTQEHGDDLRRAQLMAQWAQTKRRFGDLTRANAMLRRSIDLYRAGGSVGGEGRSLGNLANLLEEEGAATAALEMYEQAVALFRTANLPADLALALRSLGLAYARRGAYDLALQALGDSRAVSRSLGDDRQEADAAWLEAQVHWQCDRTEAAVASARFVSERGDAAVAMEAKSMLGAAEILQALDDFIAAEDDHRRTAVITRHPALLSPSADHLLAERIETARSARSEALTRHLVRGREALARYRSEQLGREVESRWAALERIASPGTVLPGRLKPIVARLTQDTDPDRQIALLGGAMGVLGDTQPMVRARLLSEVGRGVLDARDDAPAREQAIAALEEALALWDRERDPEGWAASQDALGRAYRNRSLGNPGENVERAIGCFRAALSVYRRRSHREAWVAALTNLANAYRSREKGDRATNMERAIRRYEAVIEATTVEESPRLRALVHGNLGYAYADRVLGNLAENVEDAIRYLGRALDARAQLTEPEVVAMLLNRSYALRKRVEGDRTDNIERAIQDLDAALAEARRAGLRLLEAQAASNLGAAWDERRAGNPPDNVEKAIEWYQRALEVQSREATPAAWAATVDNLANAYSRRTYGRADKNLDRAIELHESALSVYSPEFQPIEWARALHNLATSLLRRHGPAGGAADRAIALYRQALTVRRRESTPFDWAETTDALARALAGRGGTGPAGADIDEAIVRYREALEVFDPGLIPDRARTTAASLGSLHAWLGQWSEAAAAFRLGIDAGERLYRSSILRASKDLELSESGDLARRAAYALGRCSDLTGAVTVLEVGRARALREALERDRVRLTAVEGENPGAVRAYEAAVERLRRLETAQRVSGGSTGELSPGRDQRALVAEHRDAQAELDTALERIRRLPGFERLLMAPSFSDVGEAALAGCPLAYLLVTDWGSLALVVSRDGQRGEPVVTAVEEPGLTTAELGATLVKWDGETVLGGYLPAALVDYSKMDEALARLLPLLGRLLGPLVRSVKEAGNSSVVLIPGGVLALLPIHAAVDAGSSGEPSVLDAIEVRYAPSALALTAARAALRRLDENVRVLAGIADPTGDLRYAKAELDIIGETFPHARLRFGADATTAQLLTDVAGAGYVHLACHGEYDVGDPLASKVVLHDGALTLRDLIGLTAFASVRLVTASACQTGITDVVRLPDEAVGLPAGFLQSGAAGVVATLWSVQDASTALLMSRFYELLSGRDADGTPAQPPPAALRQAQLWLRDLSGEAFGQYATARPALESRFGRALDFARAFPDIRPFAGPYHWAPFVFVGA